MESRTPLWTSCGLRRVERLRLLVCLDSLSATDSRMHFSVTESTVLLRHGENVAIRPTIRDDIACSRRIHGLDGPHHLHLGFQT